MGRRVRRFQADDPVALVSCSSYDTEPVRAALEEALRRLGGLKDFIKPGDSVLLKPNFLRTARPEAAVTTYPAVVEAVALMVRDAGAIPVLGDSPALQSCERVAEVSGIAAVCRRLNIPLLPFKEKVVVGTDGRGHFRRFDVAKEVTEVDRIINLPKAKTHQQMTLTLGVKNLFGCIVGTDKSKWHLRAGMDSRFFGRMLAELALAVGADLTILDAVVGMDGDGPGGGRVRPFGFLAAGPNPFTLDVVVSELFGIPAKKVPALASGIELGAAPASARLCSIAADGDWRAFAVPDFLPPGAARVGFNIPGPLFRFLRRFFTPRPKIDRKLCVLCNACVEACPAECMTNTGDRIVIRYDDCISCYCCAEVCPHKAVKIK
jgi:uncharacterized protein (DUF362 family)/Pyruvate/2-oxoacid:ferredoxin oxidoreductase delta subunit